GLAAELQIKTLRARPSAFDSRSLAIQRDLCVFRPGPHAPSFFAKSTRPWIPGPGKRRSYPYALVCWRELKCVARESSTRISAAMLSPGTSIRVRPRRSLSYAFPEALDHL